MKKIKNWLLSSTQNKAIFGCGIAALLAIICLGSFFIYKNVTKHEHTVDYKYESLNDGTHKKTSYCTDEDGKKCKGFNSETTTEECEFDKDGICKYCGYFKYVTVKFLSNIDDSVVKEMKVERGTTLDSNKDFPEAPTVEGYEFKEFQGKYDNIEFDTDIILVYEAVNEEKKEESSTYSINNTNKSNTTISNSNNDSNSSSSNISNSSNSNDEDYSDWGNSSSTSQIPYELTEQGIQERALKFQTWLTTDPTVDAFYTEHGWGGSKQLTEGIGGEFDVLLIGADGATQTIHYKP